MKNLHKNQAGFSHFLLLALITVILGAVGLVGYRVMNESSKDEQASTAVPANTTEVEQITTKTDLETAEAQIDSADIDGELDPAELDEDINDLL